MEGAGQAQPSNSDDHTPTVQVKPGAVSASIPASAFLSRFCLTGLRALMLLALIVWIGGVVFFAFVLAPAVFSLLPVPVAGNVVSASLSRLHGMGLVSGAIFLISSLAYSRLRQGSIQWLSATHIFLLVMLCLTAVAQFGITPRMRELRRAGLDTFSARAEFDRLHGWSTRSEGGVLLLGLVVVVLTAREQRK